MQVSEDIHRLLEGAVALHRGGRFSEACEVYEAVLSRDADNADAMHLLGVCRLRIGFYADAVDLMRRAIELRPDFVECRFNLARACFEGGEYNECVDQLTICHRLRPGWNGVDEFLGMAKRKLLTSGWNSWLHTLEGKHKKIEFGSQYSLTNVAPGYARGRDVRASYLRACGLQFGSLGQACSRDDDFRAAMALANERDCSLDPLKLANLFCILSFELEKLGNSLSIVELGVYGGGSSCFMAYLAKKFLRNAQVWGFDSFAGMPAPTKTEAMTEGSFCFSDYDGLVDFVAKRDLDNLRFVKGFFDKSIEPVKAEIGQIGLVHFDCDYRSSIETSWRLLRPQLAPGAFIVFDDALVGSCLGAMEAVEDLLVREEGLSAEQTFPHLVYRIPPQ